MAARQRVTTAQRRRRMGERHRLVPSQRVDDVVEITRSMGALHSTDPATVFLSAFARMASPSVGAVEHALYSERSVVRHHGMRRTVWIYTPEVARCAHGACTAEIARREWKQLIGWVENGDIVDGSAWVLDQSELVLGALRRHGALGARQLGKLEPTLAAKITIGNGKFTNEVSAHTRILQNLAFDGSIVRTVPTGTWISGEYVYAPMDTWLAEGLVGMEVGAARAGLARAYLAAFGPVTFDDLKWWAAWTMGATKSALAAIGAVEVELDDGATGWALPEDPALAGGSFGDDDELWVALVPSLDPTTMGWKDRGWYLGEYGAFGGPMFDRNGNVGPAVIVNGRVVGAWTQLSDGSIAHGLLEPVDAQVARLIGAESQRLQEAIGSARVTPRYPTALQKSLNAAAGGS